MTGSPEFLINEALYQWCVRAFSLLRRRLGIDIKLHGGEDRIAAGQIFLFNHFARFETIIPQYFIYQATGAYCRCVATHELFTGGGQFAKFLKSCGAVPNTHPGLLPFLAAEILRGRKVIFFPEGSMIKDRRIFAPSGIWPVLRATARHRQGAAALALVLEAFKRRILSVHESGDTARLGRWVAALGLGDVETLLAAARKPTLIVPGNITFYPIHTGDNILRKMAEFFTGGIGEQVREELLIEGNLILRHTDMDIRLGRPVDPHLTWNPADRMLLARAFEQVDSLPDLFGLKDKADRWIDRMAAVTMRRKTRQLRDLCMAEMYAHVTVNLNHLASRLILRLYDSGEIDIARGRFHRLLYRILKDVQKLPGIHLHRSLADPETYDGVHDGSNGLFAEFLATAAVSGLIAAEADSYRLLPALAGGKGGRDPRLENVVRVYANEIASLGLVTRIVDRARPAAGPELAHLLFDDELRAHAQAKQKHAQARHAAVNGVETMRDGEPYLLLPERPGKPGVVLVHGFLASPAELKALGQRLAGQGHPVLGVRLKGHGTSPWDLRERNWQDWLASVKRGYEIMALLGHDVLLAGFATGASMALHVAAARPPGLAGVVAVSAPIKFRDRNLTYAPLIHGINRLAEWVYAEDGIKPFHIIEPDYPDIRYRHMPVRGLVELRRAADELEQRLPGIACPVHIVQATDDPIVDPDSARIVHGRIGSAEKSLHMIASNRHSILHEDLGGAQSLVVSLLGAFAALPKPAPLPAMPIANPLPKIGAAIARVLALFLSRLRPRQAAPPPPREPYPWEKSYPAGVDWRAAIVARPLTELFDEAVNAHADKTCLNYRGKHYSYREVGRLVDRAARGFQALGVRRGIKVALVLPNCPYAVICFHAVLKAGGTVVNINPLYSRVEIERQVIDADARILVSLDVKALYGKVASLSLEGGCLERLIVCRMKGVLRFTEKLVYGFFRNGETADVAEDDRHIFFERLLANDGNYKPVAIDPMTEVAVLQYTGGTTGLSKGAQLTHANLYVNAAQLALWAPNLVHGREKSLAVLPLFHAFGMTAVMNLGLWIGAELLLLARFQTVDVLETIDREKPAIFIGVPTMFSALIDHRDIAKYDLSSLSFCISGGAPLSAGIQQRFEQLAGCKLIEGYGLSEAGPVCTVNPLDGGKPGSVGLPLPGTVIEIVSLEDPQKLLGPGERGEICVTGPQVMAGYANRAQENVDAFRGGRLHTGDVGYLDEDGYLFIVDRIKDLILSSGFNVYPRQIEDAILEHPAVAEAAVRGVPDSHRGEIVKAYIRLHDGAGLTVAEMREFLIDRLAPFELPRRIEFRSSLPHTFMGKISKKELETEPAAEVPVQKVEA
ncbi:MAG: AMP-binding protein [Hyphomicrobiales bacterium]